MFQRAEQHWHDCRKRWFVGGIMSKRPWKQKTAEGGPVESLRSMQVHCGASSTASAPTDTLFVGRAVSVVTRPPACVERPSEKVRKCYNLGDKC